MQKMGIETRLQNDLKMMAADLAIEVESINWPEIPGIPELLLDSSGGVATEWFATGLHTPWHTIP